jgi:hypothetical protein
MVGDAARSQRWLFIVARFVGGPVAAMMHRFLHPATKPALIAVPGAWIREAP